MTNSNFKKILLLVLIFNFAFLSILFFQKNLAFSFMSSPGSKSGGLTPPPIPSDEDSPFQTMDDILYFLQSMFWYLAVIFWLFAIGAIFYAGYLFIFEGASGEKVDRAKKMLKYAVIAIVIGLMAYGIPELILNILRGRGDGGRSIII